MKVVIDGDNDVIVEKFDEQDTTKIIKKYEDLGYEDVGLDYNNDIIIFKEL